MKFRKKPVVIEAIQFDGNSATIDHFIGGEGVMRRITDNSSVVVAIGILTKEGEMRCDKGDWVIKGVKGEFYPCKPDIFAMTYEPADESPDSEAVEFHEWIEKQGYRLSHYAANGEAVHIHESAESTPFHELRYGDWCTTKELYQIFKSKQDSQPTDTGGPADLHSTDAVEENL